MTLEPGGWSTRIATRKYGADFRVFGIAPDGGLVGPVNAYMRLDKLPEFADAAPEGVHEWTLSGVNLEAKETDANGNATLPLANATLSLVGLASERLVAEIDAYLA